MQNHKNPFEFMSGSMKHFMQNRDEMLATQRKNIEALSEANRMAVDVMKNIAQLQQQYIKQTFETISEMMHEVMSNPQDQNAWKKHADSAKEHVNRTFEHSVNVANALHKSHKDIYESMKSTLSQHVESAKKAAASRSKQH